MIDFFSRVPIKSILFSILKLYFFFFSRRVGGALHGGFILYGNSLMKSGITYLRIYKTHLSSGAQIDYLLLLFYKKV